MKKCEICHDEYEATRSNQKYCKVCGKKPDYYRNQYEKAVYYSKRRYGDLYKPKEMECQECGKKIISIYNRTFCGSICAEVHRINSAKCIICDCLLIEKGIETGRRGYCSEECKIKEAEDRGDYISCKVCSKKFIRRNETNVYCSNLCYKEYVQMGKLKRVTQEEKNKKDKVVKKAEVKKCKNCKKSFVMKSSNQIYCTVECRKIQNNLTQQAKTKKILKKSLEKLNLGVDLHICTVCKTSQKECDRFTSGFVYHPKGAVTRNINGKIITTECPKFI